MSEQIDRQRRNEELALMLANELHSYSLEEEQKYMADKDHRGKKFFPPDRRRRIKEIGHVLNSVGGEQLMHTVCDGLPSTSQIYVDKLWNGIGSWQS